MFVQAAGGLYGPNVVVNGAEVALPVPVPGTALHAV